MKRIDAKHFRYCFYCRRHGDNPFLNGYPVFSAIGYFVQYRCQSATGGIPHEFYFGSKWLECFNDSVHWRTVTFGAVVDIDILPCRKHGESMFSDGSAYYDLISSL